MDKLTEKQKLLLRELYDFTCENCKKTELELSRDGDITKLEMHRIKQGGNYEPRNIKVLCPKCHKIFTSAQNKASGITK